VYSNYPQLENIVKYVSDAAAVSVLVVYIWAITGWRRRPVRPLIVWPLVALLTFHLLLDLVYWRRPAWTIHFAIQCAALFFVLVLAIRGRKEGNRRKAGIPGTDDNQRGNSR